MPKLLREILEKSVKDSSTVATKNTHLKPGLDQRSTSISKRTHLKPNPHEHSTISPKHTNLKHGRRSQDWNHVDLSNLPPNSISKFKRLPRNTQEIRNQPQTNGVTV